MKALLFCLLMAAAASLQAQIPAAGDTSDAPLKRITYVVRVKADNNNLERLYLRQVNDSAITLSRNAVRFGTAALPGDLWIGYGHLDKIAFHRKGAAGRTALVCGGIGLALGAIVGFISGDDPKDSWIQFSAGEKAFAIGLTLGTFGALLGAVFGAINHQLATIARSKTNFDEFRNYIFAKTKKAHLEANW